MCTGVPLSARGEPVTGRAGRTAPSACCPGDLLRLVGYGVLYETAHLDEVPEREDLTLVLVVASVTPTLHKEIERKGWTLTLLVDRSISLST